MTKSEALAALEKSGEVTVFRRTPTWESAFKLFNDAHGTNRNPNCGTCFREVLAWLRS